MIHVVSPHLDDAVLSVGQTIAGADDDVEVVTVFAGLPSMGVLSAYDAACGFASSEKAMVARRDEDARACWRVGASVKHLAFLDRQYRDGADADFESMVAALGPLWAGPSVVFAPVGVGHPDHEVVAAAALVALLHYVDNERVALFVYEELPYRVLHPEVTVRALDRLRAAQALVVADVPEPFPQGDRAVKADAVAEYVSQFPDGADDPCLLVPERCWRVIRREA